MDAFQFLGTDRRGATLETLRKAWKKACLIHHPDRNRDHPEEAHKMTVEINRACEIACAILNSKPRKNVRFAEPESSESPRSAPESSERYDDGARASSPPRYRTSHGQNGYSQNDHSEDYHGQDDHIMVKTTTETTTNVRTITARAITVKTITGKTTITRTTTSRATTTKTISHQVASGGPTTPTSATQRSSVSTRHSTSSRTSATKSTTCTPRESSSSQPSSPCSRAARVFNSIQTLHDRLDHQLCWEYDPDADREGWTLDALIEDGDGIRGRIAELAERVARLRRLPREVVELMAEDAGAGWRGWAKRRRVWNAVQEGLVRDAGRSRSYRGRD